MNKTMKFSKKQLLDSLPVVVLVIGRDGIASIHASSPVKVVMIDQSDEECNGQPQLLTVDTIGDVTDVNYGAEHDDMKGDLIAVLSSENFDLI